jgi:hypothetical protein
MLGSNGEMPVGDSALAGGIFTHWNQKISRPVSPAASSFAAPRSATTNCEEQWVEKYALYINWLIGGSTSPQIWPHLAVLVVASLLRYAAPAIQSNPSRRCRKAIREQDFLLPK